MGKRIRICRKKGEFIDEREENKKYLIKMTTSLKYLSKWFRFGADLLFLFNLH